MDVKLIGAIATLIAASIGFTGGFLSQHLATERAIYTERLDNINSLRSETYVDFFSAVAKNQQALQFDFENYEQFVNNKPEDDKLAERLETALWEYHLEMKEGRLKLAAFAPTNLVHALADFYLQEFPMKDCNPHWSKDVKTYIEMRKALLAGIEDDDVKPGKLYLLMFNCRPIESTNISIKHPK